MVNCLCIPNDPISVAIMNVTLKYLRRYYCVDRLLYFWSITVSTEYIKKLTFSGRIHLYREILFAFYYEFLPSGIVENTSHGVFFSGIFGANSSRCFWFWRYRFTWLSNSFPLRKVCPHSLHVCTFTFIYLYGHHRLEAGHNVVASIFLHIIPLRASCGRVKYFPNPFPLCAE